MSDIPKLFAEYQARAATESQESEGPDHKSQPRLFDSVLPQIFGYMCHGVSTVCHFALDTGQWSWTK